jgi:hypothetical protein
VDPSGPEFLNNIVVACRGCNSRKGDRTLAEVASTLGMTLLPPPTIKPDQAAPAKLSSPQTETPTETETSTLVPSERGTPPTARSGRPIFKGTRFVVFEWQLDDLRNALGPYVEDFALDEWFHTLNQRCERENVVAPKRDGGAWLQAELVREANRRGIPLRIGSTQPEAGKLTTRMAQMVRNAQ